MRDRVCNPLGALSAVARPGLVLLPLLALAAAGTAHAGGVYLYELDAASTALASAGSTARAEDAGTIFSNPAGMARLGNGAIQASLLPLYLDTRFDSDPSRTSASGPDGDASSWIPLAGFEYVHALSEDVKLGLAVGGYFWLADKAFYRMKFRVAGQDGGGMIMS